MRCAVQTDIMVAANAEQLAQTVVDRFGRLDILVNNVGDFRRGALAETSVENWQSIFASNLMSVLYMSRAALPHMRRTRWGRIINLGAVGAERAFGQATISAYAAAKAAVVALLRSLALEEAKNGITVNVVNPSNIDEKELSLEEARRMRDARFPIGRPPNGRRCCRRRLIFRFRRNGIRDRPNPECQRRLDAVIPPKKL